MKVLMLKLEMQNSSQLERQRGIRRTILLKYGGRYMKQGAGLGKAKNYHFGVCLIFATLLVATINNKQSNLGEYFQDQESELELRSYLEENMEV